ncbi:MAG: PepSY-associated TM helix domain-containing protein [Bacteroidota bacterium]|nr:PepSY-associated TM helix domain-containing protein [Bacteroidota bacterium]
MYKETSKFLKHLRKWSRILHRDLGFFFFGVSIIFGLSGIALNHINDWNPNYIVSIDDFETNSAFSDSITKEKIVYWLEKNNYKEKYKTHYLIDNYIAKIYLTQSITIILDTKTGNGTIEQIKRRPIFYESNYLHYNPNKWWTWFSDAFAGTLILFAITGLIMVRGKKGVFGRGGIYLILGIIIPLLILFFS